MRPPETYLALGIGVLLFLSISLGSVPLVSAYTVHDPILITSNAMFDAAHGVTSGSGTASDPYIIEGWAITETSGVNGIDIQNTTAYFIIRNCSIKASTVWSGVYLLNVTNGTVTSNYCYTESIGRGYGILVVESSSITVSHNTIEDMNWGIYVSWSDYCTIDFNNVDHVGAYGISVFYYSTNNSIINNISNYSKWGILLFKNCQYNEIINNTCEHNAAYGIGLYENCSYNTLTGNMCETDGIFIDTTSDFGNVLLGNTPDEPTVFSTPTLPQPFPGPTDPPDTPEIPGADPSLWLPLMMSVGLIVGMTFIGFNLTRSSRDPIPGLFMAFTGIMLAWAIGWLDLWIFVTAIAFIAILGAVLWGKIFSRK